MTDATEGLRIALESAESDLAQLRAENAALLERMVRAEKAGQSARACMAVLLPDATLDALAKGKAIDDGGESVEDVLRARVAELNDALDLAAGDNAALRAQNAYLAPRQRAGQLVANAVYVLDPEFYEAHRGTAIDTFNHDESVVDYLRAWRESERALAKSELSAAKDRVEQRMDQVIALESIIEGPPFPPDAMVVAKHIANGGVWVVLWQDAHGLDGSLCRNPDDVQKLLRTQGPAPHVVALDANGRPCARPAVKR